MEQSGNALLLRFINSQHFNLFYLIAYLQRYANNIGIHHYLCNKASAYSIEELKFFIPQFLQLLLTVETDSMALEELIKNLCSVDVHFSLITFWHLQASLQDLSKDPKTMGFQICKRLLNDLQFELFQIDHDPFASSSGVVSKNQAFRPFRENMAPSVVLASSVLASVALPQIARHTEPIVKAQGKLSKSFVFQVVKGLQKELNRNLTLKNTKANAVTHDEDEVIKNDAPASAPVTRSASVKSTRPSQELDFAMIDRYAEQNMPSLNKTLSANSLLFKNKRRTAEVDQTSSMPNLHLNSSTSSLEGSNLEGTKFSDVESLWSGAESIPGSPFMASPHPDSPMLGALPLAKKRLTVPQKIKLLKSNYFKSETQFAIALQNISIKLSQVPKEARLSCLKAELSLLNKDLPREVDIPYLLPPSKKGTLHKIVRIPANESAVLNSAERVPFVLLVEYLSDGTDFDPVSRDNSKIIKHELKGRVPSKDSSYVFDFGGIADGGHVSRVNSESSEEEKVVSEADLGDVSVVNLTNKRTTIPYIEDARDGELSFQAHYSVREHTELATQMRIAAVMLTQLDTHMDLPADQSAAIKARIIASMQSLQDHFGVRDLQDINPNAGERKLSNDLKIAGVRSSLNNQKNYYLGEDWNAKRRRIRKESPFGHLDNWELFSVIAKTGDDLSQEAFACQLIHAMASIWYKNHVDVWVKRMRILVTSANTGLVETITNALSVHSIKKALTQFQVDNNEANGQIATLMDHFSQTFGDPSSTRYKRAQDSFASSLAGYSVICYVLQIKDRHNGNIMLDNEGHIVHIDFGFLLSNSPGSVGFEQAPFKLTMEYMEILGGLEGKYFLKFKKLVKDAFRCVRKNAESLITMVELMQRDSSLPCFKLGDQTSVQLRQRLQLHLSDADCDQFVEDYLIGKSVASIYTRLYDQFQLMTQGIYI